MTQGFAVHEIPSGEIRSRRGFFLLLLLAIGLPGLALMAELTWQGGFTVLRGFIFAIYTVLFAQLAYGAALALTGYWMLRRGGDSLRITQARQTGGVSRALPRTAILVPIYNEDVTRVFEGARRMFESVQRRNDGENFDFFILSDSSDPNHWIEEETNWLALCKQVSGFGRIFYRKRRVTLNHKSGNVADFCRRWGAKYRYMIVADADSVMTAETFVTLVRLMEGNPTVGIIQTAPQLVLGQSLFRRVQQFAARLYGPVFLAGANFCHMGGGNYWGHNAILRIKPFVDFCALPELPKFGAVGGRILSHDTVEAAFMRRAGYSVWLAYDLPGSYEEGPPHVPASLIRDRRWCQGNLQHLLVLPRRGIKLLSRIHILVGILCYASAPLWLLFMILTIVDSVRQHTVVSPFFLMPNHSITAGILFTYVLLLLFIPKILGIFTILSRKAPFWPGRSRARAILSVAGETLFSIFLAPILMWFYTTFVFSALTGLKVGWKGQSREEQLLNWREVFSAHWMGTTFALVWLALAWRFFPNNLPWLLPVLVPLLLSPIFSRLTSSIRLGAAARARGLFEIPEEMSPPQELAGLDEAPPRPSSFFEQSTYASHFGLLQAVLDPYVHSVHVSLLRLPEQTSEKKQEYLEELSARLLGKGPQSLNTEERNALLWDPESMVGLHRRLWLAPNGALDAWWQNALRHYNESTALNTRRSAA